MGFSYCIVFKNLRLISENLSKIGWVMIHCMYCKLTLLTQFFFKWQNWYQTTTGVTYLQGLFIYLLLTNNSFVDVPHVTGFVMFSCTFCIHSLYFLMPSLDGHLTCLFYKNRPSKMLPSVWLALEANLTGL